MVGATVLAAGAFVLAGCGGGTSDAAPGLTGVGPVGELPTADGEVALVLVGPPEDNLVPFVAHNGTDQVVSRLRLSGPVVNAEGEVVTEGSSRLVEPDLVEPGGYAVGVVIADGDRLPADATLRDPAIDYTLGADDTDDRIGLEPQGLETIGGDVAGSLVNPHGATVEGPLSVTAACIDASGELRAVLFGYPERDAVPPDGSVPFSLSSPSLDAKDCTTLLAGGSGFTGQ